MGEGRITQERDSQRLRANRLAHPIPEQIKKGGPKAALFI